jgi:lipopolysaccharide export system permease protein
VQISTNINIQKIHKGILEPKSISLVGLPSFIKKLEKLGFTTTKYSLYFYQLLFAPFLFASLSLLGLALSFSTPRSNKVNLMVAISIFLGFTIYFFFRLISALALAGKISTLSSVIIPIIIFTLIGAIIIMHFEEQ